MPSRSRSTGKGELWHGYRRPVLRDNAFWVAVVVTAVALAIQQSWIELGDGAAGIALFALDVVITVLISFAVVGVLAGTIRGFGEGWRAPRTAKPEPADEPRQAESTPPTDRPALGVELERRARALGRAIGTTRRRSADR